MDIRLIVSNLSNLPREAILAFFVLVPIAVVIVLKKTADPKFIQKVIEQKKEKELLIKSIKTDLTTLNAGVSTLLNDKRVIGQYNTDHVGQLVLTLKNLQLLASKGEILQNKALQANILEYTKLTAELLNATFKIEEYNYSQKKDYQDLLMVGARNYRSLKSATQNEDDAHIYKGELINKLNSSKDKMLQVNNAVEHKRDEIFRGLELVQHKNGNLFHLLDAYSDKEVYSKTFYFRHLAFA